MKRHYDVDLEIFMGDYPRELAVRLRNADIILNNLIDEGLVSPENELEEKNFIMALMVGNQMVEEKRVADIKRGEEIRELEEMWTRIGYYQLDDFQRHQFHMTYKKFYEAWGNDARKKYVEENIEKLEWDQEEQTVNVYFNDGNWWHFTKDEKWY